MFCVREQYFEVKVNVKSRLEESFTVLRIFIETNIQLKVLYGLQLSSTIVDLEISCQGETSTFIVCSDLETGK